MTNKKIGIALVVIAIIAIGGYFRNPQTQQAVQQVQPQGSITGPDITSDYLSVNAVKTDYRSVVMKTGTTTSCIIRAPRDATSTLIFASASIGTATTTATTWTFAKNTTGGSATTTLISAVPLSGASEGTLLASTTPSTTSAGPIADPAFVFAPGNYLVVANQGLAYNAEGTINFGGVCKAEFISTSNIK